MFRTANYEPGRERVGVGYTLFYLSQLVAYCACADDVRERGLNWSGLDRRGEQWPVLWPELTLVPRATLRGVAELHVASGMPKWRMKLAGLARQA